MRGKATHRLIWHETLLALLVLSLSFVNFGHTNAVLAAGGRVVITTTSFCGNPFLPAAGDHAPCPACAIGAGADLPPAPCMVAPVAFAVTPVAYAEPVRFTEILPALTAARPRAPPLA